MEIWRASDGDLSALVAVLGQRHFFVDCLARQRCGHGSCWSPGSMAGRWATRS
jgi:hypothetical protein